MKRYVIRVSGKVQGVLYRDAARQTAGQLGLSGFARNEPDGSVYIEVEGEEAALKDFLAWCHEGPQLASVTEVQHTEKPAAGHKDFTIG